MTHGISLKKDFAFSSPESVLRRIRSLEGDVAVFLDMDGTLLDFHPDPDSVHIPADLEDAVEGLHHKLDGALAIVTGRDGEFLKIVFPNLQPPAAVSHGARLRMVAGGDFVQLVPDVEICQLDQHLQDRLSRSGLSPDDLRLETKEFAVALHWRGARPEQIAGIERVANAAAESAMEAYNQTRDPSSALHITHGDMVIEIAPVLSTKGQVIERIMQYPPFRGRTPVFFEDSTAGISGMHAVKRYNGLAIGVGTATAAVADLLLADPQAVRHTLSTWRSSFDRKKDQKPSVGLSIS